MANLNFKPKQVTKRLLTILPPRAKDILSSRYGLNGSDRGATLEAIGSSYGITRERVRQIENYALNAIRKSDLFESERDTFTELSEHIDLLGAVVSEEELLQSLGKDKESQNHAHLLLVLGEPFSRMKEDREFTHRWVTDHEVAENVHVALRELYENLSDDELVPESELLDTFLSKVKVLNQKYKQEEVLKRWLALSKTMGKNPLGEWGRASSPNVRAKGVRDFAYLAIKRHGSPMHFSEVAKTITELFDRKAHVATCHNELIKDSRFVLVGRGLYALSEWGYSSGVVKDVIRALLAREGSLTREEIIDRVRKERYVKDNTILVNLQDSRFFKRDGNGRYLLA